MKNPTLKEELRQAYDRASRRGDLVPHELFPTVMVIVGLVGGVLCFLCFIKLLTTH